MERRRLLRPLRPDEDEPEGLRGRDRLPQDPGLRPAAQARPGRGRHLLRGPRAAARLPERSPPTSTTLSTRVPPAATRTRRHSLGYVDEEKGRSLGARLRRAIASAGRSYPKLLRQPRPGLRPAAEALLPLAARLRRLLPRRDPRRALRQLLLRRLRQQLGRPPGGEALPRVAQPSRGSRSTRSGGRNFASGLAGVEPAPAALPRRRQAGLLPDLGAPGAVRQRARDGPGRRRPSPDPRQRGRARSTCGCTSSTGWR